MKAFYTAAILTASAFAQSTDMCTLSNPCAMAYIDNRLEDNGVLGWVRFEPAGGLGTLIVGQVHGLEPGTTHDIHIHEHGDITEGCASFDDHFNPNNLAEDYEGLLGVATADSNGMAEFSFFDEDIALTGSHHVLGRGFVVHGNKAIEDEATARLACGIIGVDGMSPVSDIP